MLFQETAQITEIGSWLYALQRRASLYDRPAPTMFSRMSIEPLQRGPHSGQVATEPMSPKRVREIVRLREDEKLTFDEIAKRLGGTRMNACTLYNRWRDWAHQEKKPRQVVRGRRGADSLEKNYPDARGDFSLLAPLNWDGRRRHDLEAQERRVRQLPRAFFRRS
jgi:hypothetical protein